MSEGARPLFGFCRRVMRAHPRWLIVLAVLLILAGTAAGGYGYALWQWASAREAVRHDRPEEAQAALNVCLAVWPRDLRVHLLAARAARLRKDLPGAEAHLNRCLKIQGGATEDVQLEFLLLRVQAGEADEVAPTLMNFVQHKHPETPIILKTLARSYMHQLRYGPAYDFLSQWIRAEPEAAEPYHWRGWILERLDHPHAAMRDYRAALERSPELFIVRLRLAEMLLEDQNLAEALPHLERLCVTHAGHPDVKARLGQCRYLQGEAAEARRLLEEALPERPDDAPLRLYLARLDLQEGKPAAAEVHLRHLLKVDPSDTEGWHTLANALQMQGRATEAAKARAAHAQAKALLDRANRLLKEEAQQPTRDADTAHAIGAALLQIGRDRLALYWLDQALVRDPNFPATHRLLADYYERQGDRAAAAAHRQRLGGASSSARDAARIGS